MRFRVDGQRLAEALGWVARCLPSRPSSPVLGGVLLTAVGSTSRPIGAGGGTCRAPAVRGAVPLGQTTPQRSHDSARRGRGGAPDDRGGTGVARLAAFDHEVAAQDEIDCEVAEPGRVLLSGRLLAEISRSLPPGPVDLSTAGDTVTLSCTGTTFALRRLPVDDYPALPAPPPTAGRVGSDALAAAVRQVCLAAGRDDTEPVLSGVRIEVHAETLRLSCTDRYRVAVRELAWHPDRTGRHVVALAPARTLAATIRSLTGAAQVHIGLAAGGAGLIGLRCAGRQCVARLLEHDDADYLSRLPWRQPGHADLATGPLLDAVRRVALVAARHTPIRLTLARGTLTVEAGSGDDAHAVARVPADHAGGPLSIAFNPRFLLDGLSAVESDTTRLSYSGPHRPALLTGKPADAGAFRYLLMPVIAPVC